VKFLLDTNTCIDLVRGAVKVVRCMARETPEDCGISTVTAYELFCGVLKCKRPEDELRKVGMLLRTVHLLEFDEHSARVSAQVRHDLEARGKPIGPYDLLLAGQALAGDLTLVTSNTGEFSRIPDLRLGNWRL
jgi:tRNA(fMet)-specific endonuclease VapC